LYYSDECPDGVPYVWTNLYRPESRRWGFGVSRKLFDTLKDGIYDVDLATTEESGTMKVLDYLLPGESGKTILINAHNCHSWQANDDISGCAVGISILRELQQRKRRKYSYRLVIAPELIGAVHWLNGLADEEAGSFIGGIMLKSVGNTRPMKLQHSFNGNSQLDRAASCTLKARNPDLVEGAFRTIYGNDETVFDSPGYEIPSISITRFPFKEYHTDRDTPEMLSEHSLIETRDAVLEIINGLEANERYEFTGRGLVSLSSPRYDLYRPAPAPGVDREDYQAISGRWNLFMNCLPRELDGDNSIVDLACKYDLPPMEVAHYLAKWEKKGLASRTIDQ
jgi:aminopeptidase-like protein